jgi:Tol biopolymer transport system component
MLQLERSLRVMLFLVLSLAALSCRTAKEVPAATESAGQPDWRQSKIVFDSARDGDQEIYVMNPDGSNQQRLTNNKADDRHPSWSPDGKRIAFASTRDGNTAIFAMDPDGSNVTRLTKSADEHQAWGPDWSPDGKRILFQSPRDGNVEDIFVMDADGSNVQRLTNTPGSGKFSSDQAWSPDGNWIAFDSNRDGNEEIYLMSSDGSNLKRLTDTPGTPGKQRSYKPQWSPDGKRFAFGSTRDRSSDNWVEIVEIYTMDTDGSNIRRLTHTTDEGYSSSDAKWSPDGKKIAFLSGPGAKITDGDKSRLTQWREGLEIYVMDADGSNVQRLTFNEAHDGHHDW